MNPNEQVIPQKSRLALNVKTRLKGLPDKLNENQGCHD